MSVSLNGFIEAANGDILWSSPDEELHRHFNDLERTIKAHRDGRRMYEIMAAFWPTADEHPSGPRAEVEYARICVDRMIEATSFKNLFHHPLKYIGTFEWPKIILLAIQFLHQG